MRTAFLLLAALLARIAAGEWALDRQLARMPDSELYLAHAASILRGGPYGVGGDRAQRTPGYPVFLALIQRVFGPGDRPILWAQAMLSTATCGAAFLTARRLEGAHLPPGAATWTLWFTAAEPYAILLSALVLSETLFATLLCATVFVGARLEWNVPSSRFAEGLWGAALGAAAGAAALVRPSGLLLIPVAAATWAAMSSRRSSVLRILAAAAVGFFALWAPWWARNFEVYGCVVLTTLNVGESLYDGVRPGADGASDTSFAQAPESRAMPELARDAHWRERSIGVLRGEPARIARLALTKFGRFWSPWPNDARFRTPWILAATTALVAPIYFFALVGGGRSLRQPGVLALCLLPAAYFCTLHMIFVSSVRYRAPAMPLLAVLAGAGAASLWGRTAKSQ